MSIQLSKDCANCFHSKESHHDGVCMGDLSCQCFEFVSSELNQFAGEIEKAKHELKKIEERCKWILEKIPQTRNAGEKTFVKIYNEIWYGFKIRKYNASTMDKETFDRLPNADSINRAKRKVKHDHQELQTYSPEMLKKQGIYQMGILEWVTDL